MACRRCSASHARSSRARAGTISFIDPEWVGVIKERRAAVARGEPLGGEMKVHTVTGQSKWLQASAVPVRDPRTGAVIGALGSCYDITESKLAEIALHESRSTLLTVAESSADVLALFDRQRKCVFLNRSILGLDARSVARRAGGRLRLARRSRTRA